MFYKYVSVADISSFVVSALGMSRRNGQCHCITVELIFVKPQYININIFISICIHSKRPASHYFHTSTYLHRTQHQRKTFERTYFLTRGIDYQMYHFYSRAIVQHDVRLAPPLIDAVIVLWIFPPSMQRNYNRHVLDLLVL